MVTWLGDEPKVGSGDVIRIIVVAKDLPSESLIAGIILKLLNDQITSLVFVLAVDSHCRVNASLAPFQLAVKVVAPFVLTALVPSAPGVPRVNEKHSEGADVEQGTTLMFTVAVSVPSEFSAVIVYFVED